MRQRVIRIQHNNQVPIYRWAIIKINRRSSMGGLVYALPKYFPIYHKYTESSDLNMSTFEGRRQREIIVKSDGQTWKHQTTNLSGGIHLCTLQGKSHHGRFLGNLDSVSIENIQNSFGASEITVCSGSQIGNILGTWGSDRTEHNNNHWFIVEDSNLSNI